MLGDPFTPPTVSGHFGNSRKYIVDVSQVAVSLPLVLLVVLPFISDLGAVVVVAVGGILRSAPTAATTTDGGDAAHGRLRRSTAMRLCRNSSKREALEYEPPGRTGAMESSPLLNDINPYSLAQWWWLCRQLLSYGLEQRRMAAVVFLASHSLEQQ